MKPRNPDRVPKDVYLSLVTSLFWGRTTLAFGAVIHAAVYAMLAARANSSVFLLLAFAFPLVFCLRMITFRQFDRQDRESLDEAAIRQWEIRYAIGAGATASLLGFGAGYAMLVYPGSFAELASVTVMLATMVSIVGRNYGSEKAITLQIFGCVVPVIACSLPGGDVYRILLSLLILPYAFLTRAMAMGIRAFVYDKVLSHRQASMIATSFDTAINNMPHGLIMVDAENRIEVINRKACELLKIGDPDLLKARDLDAVLRFGARYSFMDAAQPEFIQRQIRLAGEGRLSRTLIHFPEGLALEFSAKRREDGGAVLLFEDVSSRVKAEQKILQMVRFDALTGLPNREYFADCVEDRLAAQKAAGGPLALMIVDIDEFKHINDMRGHATGDRLLCAVAARIEAGGAAVAGRMMSDKFLIFFGPGEDREALESRIKALHAQLQAPYEIDGQTFLLSLSAGYVVVEAGGAVMIDDWSMKADLALFEAKARLSGGISGFEREMDGRYLETQQLKADLREAVEKGELSVVYQPMFSPDGGRIESAEALSRWVHPVKGAIPPDVFIRLAEEMGIISRITALVLKRACLDCMTWPEPIGVSVNLSARDLRDCDIVALVSATLEETGLQPQRLHLEITESCLIDEPAAVRATLAELRARGIAIAIDDFGTGFSSLSYLDTLPLDIVKIDRSFVRNIVEDARRLKLLRGIVNLARELGLRVVVEGVETMEQLSLINKHRSTDLVQGYVFSQPVEAAAVPVLSDRARVRPTLARRRPKVA